MTSLTAFLFLLTAVTSLSAQNKNSVQGDLEALQALYNSTQGSDLPKLNSESELPPHDSAPYPYMYMIDGELWWVKFHKDGGTVEWRNAGTPWKDNTGWEDMTPETMGNAVGIITNENGRVVEVDLQKITTIAHSDGGFLTSGNTVVGNLPPEIGNLKHTKNLNIKQNFFYGEIPSEIGLMEGLERLSLAGHHWEVDLNNKRLWLEAEHEHRNSDGNPFTFSVGGKDVTETNRFQTDLPASIGNLSKLELIELNHQFLTGTLPSSWGDLTSLRGLLMEQIRGDFSNSLYSSIPEAWGKMTSMVYFKVGNYNLTPRLYGSLPAGMLNWEDLVNLSVHDNQFTGQFPQFKNTTELFYFNISRNEFSGEFPWTSIFNGNNSGLNKFAITDNSFTGSLPASIPDAVYPIERQEGKYSIAAFGISYNQFEGHVPEWTTTMRKQRTYNISNNNFSGGFPPGLEKNRSLKTLRIHDNNLSGKLPDVEWETDEMNWFQIRGNNFEGEIPESWISLFQDKDGNWRSGQVFQFQGNNLSGRIPDWAKHVDIRTYVFNSNRYTFKDIGPVYEELNSADVGFSVSSQKPFGNQMNRTMPLGETAVFDLSEFDYEGNAYQWTKDGQPISGETDPVLTIQNVDEPDEGSYRLEVTNSLMSDLGTHISQPITFDLGEDDGLNSDTSGGESDDGSSDGGSGTNSDGSAAFPAAPVLYGPEDASENNTLNPLFSWSDIGADYYVLHVSRNTPAGMVIDVVVEDTTFTPNEIFDDNTVHDWRVYGVKEGEAGDWSGISRFKTADQGLPDVTDLISPEHFSQGVNKRTELEWKDTGADRYKIRMRTKRGTDYIFADESDISYYSPVEALDDTTQYVWQVKSIKNGTEGAWGPFWEFTTGDYDYIVDAPSLIAPRQGSDYNNLTPRFEWEAVDADQYIISVSKEVPSQAKMLSGDNSETIVIFEETNETIYIPEASLDPETVYYWRVQGIKNNEEGEWSEVWEFTTPKHLVSNEPGEKPLETNLAQNYPNPFNPTTQIEFTLSDIQDVTLTVYDMAGRQVATLTEGVLQAGRHTATFNASNLASGIYFYRFISDTHQITRKMTLLK